MKIKSNKRLILFVYTLLPIFLLSIGFSSWTFVFDETNSNITFDKGEIEKIDYKGCANYKKNSEYFFDYYIFDGTYKYTSKKMGLEIVVKPDLVDEYFRNSEIDVLIGVEYTVLNSIDFDIFAVGNSFVNPPTHFKCSLEGYENSYINSSELVYKKNINGNYTTYSLKGIVPLNRKHSTCLRNLCNGFTPSLSSCTFDVSFTFEILDSINLSNYLQNTEFTFTTSLGATL